MEVKIKITNAFTQAVEMDTTVRMNENLDNMHRLLCEAYPDSFVNFYNSDRGINCGFIFGQPYNMAADERAHAEGRLTWNDYLKRWYPNLAN
jgi:hypothetical protein